MNEVMLIACSSLLKKLGLRIFTLEQTYGILYDRYLNDFNVMVQGFKELGYSVR
jgi:DNA (cytosine-5)-methyltransferase 1